jgi:cysteine-rich repeat protein
LTATPTSAGAASSTATPSPSATPSPAASPSPLCGNGTLDLGEECDDGNVVDGDGCGADCTSELIPGGLTGGLRKNDCFHEWLASPAPVRDGSRMPLPRLECRDDDPACDFGPAVGDAACTFHLALCFNVTELRENNPHTERAACTPVGVARLGFTSPRESKPRDTADEMNRDALERAVAGLGAVVRGQCSLGISAKLCATDSDCDPLSSSGHGRCRGRLMAFEPDLATHDVCTEFAPIVVPLRRSAGLFRFGKRWIRLNTIPSSDPGKHMNGRHRIDRDVIKLVCKPPR